MLFFTFLLRDFIYASFEIASLLWDQARLTAKQGILRWRWPIAAFWWPASRINKFYIKSNCKDEKSNVKWLNVDTNNLSIYLSKQCFLRFFRINENKKWPIRLQMCDTFFIWKQNLFAFLYWVDYLLLMANQVDPKVNQLTQTKPGNLRTLPIINYISICT